jgi:hypothetical protein
VRVHDHQQFYYDIEQESFANPKYFGVAEIANYNELQYILKETAYYIPLGNQRREWKVEYEIHAAERVENL